MKKLWKWLTQIFIHDPKYKDPATQEVVHLKFLEDKEFNNWAFGPGYKAYNPLKKLDQWNKLHGDLITFTPPESKFQAFLKMEEIWLKQKELYGKDLAED